MGLASMAAMAEDSFYFGTWKIESASVAPWADAAARKPDEVEMKSLVGKTIIIKAGEITGPRQLACKGPNYVVKNLSSRHVVSGRFRRNEESRQIS